ncbi:hypothetical protein Gpo141_00005448 [Globisporangium polare]
MPLALQRLSVSEILSDGAGLALLEEEIPTGEELRISKEQELSFNRLLKFLNMHEPTGYEKDEAHKRAVVQCLALRSMLTECKGAKVLLVAGFEEQERSLRREDAALV